jgi:protein TonB
LDLASNEFKNSVEFKEANVAIESIGASTLYQPAPQYPQQAIEQDQQGEVLIEVETDEDGLVESARVVKSSGFVSLDEEGVATVWKWRLPANRLMIVPIRFQLSEQ